MAETEPKADKPKRKARRSSAYLVLRALGDPGDKYEKVAEGASVKACKAVIVKEDIEGMFTIVCVRGRVTAKRETKMMLS